MSQTIDEKVVEMRFDNSKFEKNVSQSMSTLDKLKAKLNFKDATESLEDFQAKTSNISFDKMASSIEAIEKRFTTTGIIGMRVIQNLTDSAMQFVGKTESFVKNGIINGGLNRATKIINAQFQLQGLLKDADAVSAVMKNVSDSVDGTAYSMDAAASVASQLAASGMRAGDQMYSALRGVAGVAAMTNSSYEDIGRIYTQVAGQGKLMGDQLLQLSGRGMNAAATLAEYLGKSEAEVRDMTSKGKIDFATFAAAMDNAFGEHAKAANSTFNGALANIKSALARTGQAFFMPLKAIDGPFVKLFNTIRVQINGMNKILNPATTNLANSIGKVVESLSGLVETVDFTPAANTIAKVIDAAGKLISKIDFSKITNKLKGASNPYADLANKIKEVTTASTASQQAVQDLGDVVNRVINGEFGNAPERYEKLAAAGFDWAAVQNKVNEQLGSSVRHQEQAVESQEALAQTQAVTIDTLKEMSDEQLKSVGFTDEQIKAFRELEEQSKKTGIPIEELMNNVDKLSAKSLLLDSFKNIGESLVNSFKAIGKAFGEIFGGKDSSSITDTLYSVLESFHKMTTVFKVDDEQADKLRRTFKGLFAVLDLVSQLVGGAFKMGLKAVNAFLSVFNLNILDVTAAAGDLLVKFHDFVTENDLINKGFGLVTDTAKALAEGIKGIVDAVKDIPRVQDAIQNLKDMDFGEIGKNIFEGLRKGIRKGIQKLPELMTTFAKIIISTVKKVLGIHSPSTVFFEIAQNIVQGLVNGLKAAFSTVSQAAKELGSVVVERFSGFDFSKLYAIGAALTLIFASRTIGKALDKVGEITSVFANAGKVLKSFSKAIDNIGEGMKKNLDAQAFKTRMDAVCDLIKSIVLLAGAVAVLSQIKQEDLIRGGIVVGIITAVVVGLSFLMNKMQKEAVTFDKTKGLSVKLSGLFSAFLGLSVCILALSKVFKDIGSLEPDQYLQGLKGLVAIFGLIGALLIAAKLSTKNLNMIDFSAFASMLEKMAISFGILALVIKTIGEMDSNALDTGIYVLGAFTVMAGVMAWATGFLPEKDVEQFGNMMVKLGGSFLLMAAAIKIIGGMDQTQLDKGTNFLFVFSIFVTGMMLLTNIVSDKKLSEFSLMMISISGSLLLMVIAVKLIAKLRLRDIGHGAAFMAVFGAFIAGLLAIFKRNKETEVVKCGATILALSVAIGILVGVMFLINLLDPAAIAKGLIVIGFLSLFMAGMIAACKGANECKGSIMAMAVAIGTLTACVLLLSLLDPAKLVAPTLCLSALMGMFAIVEKAGSNMQSKVSNLIMMVLIIGELAAALTIMSTIGDPTGMMAAAASMSLVLLALSASMAIISKWGNSFNASTIVAIGIMGVVIAGITFVLSLLAKCEWQNSLAAAASVSIVLVVMVGMMALVGSIGATAIAALPSVIMMTAVVAAISVCLYEIAKNPWQDSLAAAAGISLVLVAMTGCLLLLGLMSPMALVGVAAMVPMILVVGLIAVVLGLMSNFADCDAALTAAQAISLVLVAMTGSLILLGVAGAMALGVVAGLAALVGVIATMAVVCTALGVLAQIPGLQKIVADGGELLATLGYAIGNFIGSIIGGLAAGVTSGLPEIADNLLQFAMKIMVFVTTISMIGDDFASKLGGLAKGLLVLTAAEFVAGISSLLGLGLAGLGLQLTAFAVAAMPFFAITSTIDEGAMHGVKYLAEAILLLTADQLLSGITSFITGGKSFADFADSLEPLGKGIATFSSATKDVDGDKVQNAANALKTIAEACDSIPNSGGLAGFFAGNNDPGAWGSQLQALGEGIANFSNAVAGVNTDAVSAGAEAVKALAKAASDIPNSGGLLGGLVGDNDAGKFGDKLKTLGEGIAGFAESVSEVTGDSVTSVDSAIAVLKQIVNVSKDIPKSGGLSGAIFGDKGIGSFGKQLKKLGSAIVGFSTTVSSQEISAPDVAVALSVAKRVADFSAELKDFKWEKMSDFCESINLDLPTMASGLSSAQEELSDFSATSLTGAISACKTIVEFAENLKNADMSSLTSFSDTLSKFVKQLSGVDMSGVSSFASQMKGLGDTGVNAIVSAFKTSSAKASSAGATLMKSIGDGISKSSGSMAKAVTAAVAKASTSAKNQKTIFVGVGRILMASLASGITSEKTKIASNVASAIGPAITKAKGYSANFEKAGENFAKGLARGIGNKQSVVTDKVRTMCQKAVDTANKTLQIHSPSRVMAKVGKYIPLGLAKGISEFSYSVSDAARSMASKATDASSVALNTFQSLLDDIGDWQPTISPVVDMTDVKNSAGIIDRLFDGDYSMGVYAKAKPAISRASVRNQNSGNADVISAITGLRKEISGISKPTYQIDGITYDDNSSISSAIETLVDAVITERRI